MSKKNLKSEATPEDVAPAPSINPDDVRAAIGEETLAKLGRQPLAIAGGGVETLLQAACKKCAGYPNPVEAAVRELRVSCGSKATPAVKSSAE